MDNPEYLKWLSTLSYPTSPQFIPSLEGILTTLLTSPEPPIDYTLNRLLNGITTSQSQIQTAHGFLIQKMLKKLNIPIENYLKLVQEKLNIKLAIKKSEHKHFLYAQILGYFALYESKKYNKMQF